MENPPTTNVMERGTVPGIVDVPRKRGAPLPSGPTNRRSVTQGRDGLPPQALRPTLEVEWLTRFTIIREGGMGSPIAARWGEYLRIAPQFCFWGICLYDSDSKSCPSAGRPCRGGHDGSCGEVPGRCQSGTSRTSVTRFSERMCFVAKSDKPEEKLKPRLLATRGRGRDARRRPAEPQAAQQAQRVQVQIDDAKALASYANFCRVTGTPEELIIDFGLNPQPVGVPTQPIVDYPADHHQLLHRQADAARPATDRSAARGHFRRAGNRHPEAGPARLHAAANR